MPTCQNLTPYGRGMAMASAELAQRRVGRTVEILHLLGRVLRRCVPSDADAQQRLGIDAPGKTPRSLPSPGPVGCNPPQARNGLRLSGSPIVSFQSNSPKPASSRALPPKRMTPGFSAFTAATTSGISTKASSGIREALSSHSVPGPRMKIVSVCVSRACGQAVKPGSEPSSTFPPAKTRRTPAPCPRGGGGPAPDF